MSARAAVCCVFLFVFFFNDTATTEIYTLSLHDALPICRRAASRCVRCARRRSAPPRSPDNPAAARSGWHAGVRSEEHTSELQSHLNLVCRLLLEKKKKTVRSRQLCVDLNHRDFRPICVA